MQRTTSSGKKSLEFEYDASGNRIAKHVYPDNTFNPLTLEKSTYYVRDASGNVMATYEMGTEMISEETYHKLNERHIYGSSRLGMCVEEAEMIDPLSTPPMEIIRLLGLKQYEISNHLGNVLSVLTDVKLPVDLDEDEIVESYSAVIISATDYSPFGVALYGRSWSSEKYRFGFNGKEKDENATSCGGGGNQTYDYGFRIYNPALAKFLSVDPLCNSYPYFTPYQFSGNSPIKYVDLDGLEKASCEAISLARDFANTALKKASDSSDSCFPGISREDLLEQINARLTQLEDAQPSDLTNVVSWYLCGPTAIIHAMLYFEPQAYCKALIELYEYGETEIKGRKMVVTDEMQKIRIDNGSALNLGSAKVADFILIVALRSAENDGLVTSNMDILKKRHTGTLPTEMADMANRVGLDPGTREMYLRPNVRKIQKEIAKGNLVICLDNGEFFARDLGRGKNGAGKLKGDAAGIHYITIHSLSLNETDNTISGSYWEHGKLSQFKNVSLNVFNKAIKATISIGKK